jgi:hypothetical protein
MSHLRLQLQTQYANAMYQVALFTREAEIAKGLLYDLANREAEARFGRKPVAAESQSGVGE